MCKLNFVSDIFGSNPITGPSSRKQAENQADALAAQAAADRRAADEREANIRAGMGDVDTAFASFDDPFYESRRQMVLDALVPDLEKQAKAAKRQITLNLADKGKLQSSSAARAFREFNEQQAAARTDVDQRAQAAVQRLKGNVLDERSRLYDAVRGSADPRGSAAALSGAAAKQYADPNALTFDALGPIFANLTAATAGLTNVQRADQRANMANNYARSIYGSGREVTY